ncbi:MAG: hypothetical protein ACREXT_09180, partial [Gammaproteobacteria bacterium]
EREYLTSYVTGAQPASAKRRRRRVRVDVQVRHRFGSHEAQLCTPANVIATHGPRGEGHNSEHRPQIEWFADCAAVPDQTRAEAASVTAPDVAVSQQPLERTWARRALLDSTVHRHGPMPNELRNRRAAGECEAPPATRPC